MDVFPSPKSHNQELGLLDVRSEKITVPLHEDVELEVKFVIGGLLGLTHSNLMLGLSVSTPLIQLF